MTSPFAIKFHRDATVSLWDSFAQSWLRTAAPSNKLLATLPAAERQRIRRHLGLETVGEILTASTVEFTRIDRADLRVALREAAEAGDSELISRAKASSYARPCLPLALRA